MEKELERLKAFLMLYYSEMNLSRLTATKDSKYFIHISKEVLNNNEQQLHMVIMNINKNLKKIQLDETIILPNELISLAVNGIRDDFRDNHEIKFVSITPDCSFQKFNNTIFELSISIDSNEEYEEALKYNNAIMRNPNRTEETKKLVRTRENK